MRKICFKSKPVKVLNFDIIKYFWYKWGNADRISQTGSIWLGCYSQVAVPPSRSGWLVGLFGCIWSWYYDLNPRVEKRSLIMKTGRMDTGAVQKNKMKQNLFLQIGMMENDIENMKLIVKREKISCHRLEADKLKCAPFDTFVPSLCFDDLNPAHCSGRIQWRGNWSVPILVSLSGSAGWFYWFSVPNLISVCFGGSISSGVVVTLFLDLSETCAKMCINWKEVTLLL